MFTTERFAVMEITPLELEEEAIEVDDLDPVR
jgi:hypothetical protein